MGHNGAVAEEVRVIDNPEHHRYELWVGADRAGVIAYRTEPGALVLVHTEVAQAFEGRGLASRLVEGALQDMRARDLGLVPVCPFVRSYLRRNPEWLELVTRPDAQR